MSGGGDIATLFILPGAFTVNMKSRKEILPRDMVNISSTQ